MKASWIKVSLFFFFMVAVIGTSLRGVYFISLPFRYDHFVHAHSHTAFQGWVYTVTFLLLVHFYLSKNQVEKGRYPLQFKLTGLVILGVLIAFSMQGYALYSILFSFFFQLLNYWFIYRFLKDIRDRDNTVDVLFIKTGLWLGVASTVVPIAIGVLSAKGAKGTELYHSMVYTFLHLQYNGWFLFVLIGLVIKWIADKGIQLARIPMLYFYRAFAIAVIPAIALSLLGMSFSSFFVIPAYFAAFLQAIGLIYLVIAISKVGVSWMKQKFIWSTLFEGVFLISFLIKVLLQSLSAFPVFMEYAFLNKNIVLAYLHLSFIGVLSFALLAMLLDLNWLYNKLLTKLGSFLLLLGFMVTESLLLLSGVGLYNSAPLLFAGSCFMAVGVLLLLFAPGNSQLHQE